jgi:hypothetical protein
VLKNWKTRYFVLDGFGNMSYYKDKEVAIVKIIKIYMKRCMIKSKRLEKMQSQRL